MTDERAKIIDKISKIMDLVERGSTQGEREAASVQLKRLMDRHSVSEAEIAQRDQTGAPEIFLVEIFAYTPKLRSYMSMLVHVIEKTTTTKALFRAEARPAVYRGQTKMRKKEVVYLFGHKSDIAVGKRMFKILLSQIHKEAKTRIGPVYNTEHRSWLEGCCDAFWRKVDTIKPETETTAMVLVGKELAITEKMKSEIPDLQIVNQEYGKKIDYHLWLDGYKYGQETDIGNENRLEGGDETPLPRNHR